MIYIERNGQRFGPYDEQTLLSYVNSGQVLLCDVAFDDTLKPNEPTTVRSVLKRAKLRYKRKSAGGLFHQLGKIGGELIVPRKSMLQKGWQKDHRLLLLALIGLTPSVLMFVPLRGFPLFYLIALYFSVIWGLFFYYFFKTPQVRLKTTLAVFFLTQAFVFLWWDVFHFHLLNPFYAFTDTVFPLNLLGFTLGVGLTEEFVKLLPLVIIAWRAKQPLIPQTLVFYGLMSGIAFGVFEGVGYQMKVNIDLEYSASFFMNIARLTSLPFLHAVWCGIAGYFISFAKLYPRYRFSLYVLALLIPMLLHGVYDTFCGTRLGLTVAVPVMVISVFLLITYLKQSVNYQSKLRN